MRRPAPPSPTRWRSNRVGGESPHPPLGVSPYAPAYRDTLKLKYNLGFIMGLFYCSDRGRWVDGYIEDGILIERVKPKGRSDSPVMRCRPERNARAVRARESIVRADTVADAAKAHAETLKAMDPGRRDLLKHRAETGTGISQRDRLAYKAAQIRAAASARRASLERASIKG